MTYQIERICSYCKKTIGYMDGGKEPGLKSHGICTDCLPIALKESHKFLKGFLKKKGI